ncbi:hypothetical protein NDU88_010059 [Pleurodeles waltl]|uniref:Uncharacterized protein n=1 Tax=Pleurodeles waltl TaxID=8319 RepID=A0AAV7QVA4_PLEWA|nr:hypothetical protein NDU88_010059 [Pleurodeles waltl]
MSAKGGGHHHQKTQCNDPCQQTNPCQDPCAPVPQCQDNTQKCAPVDPCNPCPPNPCQDQNQGQYYGSKKC